MRVIVLLEIHLKIGKAGRVLQFHAMQIKQAATWLLYKLNTQSVCNETAYLSADCALYTM